MFFHVLMETVSFGAKNQHSGPGVFDFVVEMCAALVQAIDPEPGLFHLFERPADVGYAGDWQILERTRGGAIDGFSERR